MGWGFKLGWGLGHRAVGLGSSWGGERALGVAYAAAATEAANGRTAPPRPPPAPGPVHTLRLAAVAVPVAAAVSTGPLPVTGLGGAFSWPALAPGSSQANRRIDWRPF